MHAAEVADRLVRAALRRGGSLGGLGLFEMGERVGVVAVSVRGFGEGRRRREVWISGAGDARSP